MIDNYPREFKNIDKSHRSDVFVILEENIFLTKSGNELIFLDLSRDEYISIEPEFTKSLSVALGICRNGDKLSAEYGVSEPAFSTMLDELVSAGLVRFDANSTGTTLLEHEADICELQRFGVGGPQVGIVHLVAMAKAAASARYKLGLIAFDKVIHSIRNRRPAQYGFPDLEHVRDLVEIYRKLRPFHIARRDRCLMDALTLIEFLASFSIYPDWVFGVRTNPFAAHCWAQLGSYVLDDDLENVCDFAVIMRA